MEKTSKWNIVRGVLFIVTAAILTGCGGDQPMPPPVALTSTPLPPPPTEAPTSTVAPVPTEAPTSTPTPVPTDTPPATATAVPVSVPAPSPTYTSQPGPTEAAERLTADQAEAADQIYREKTCVACHGVNYEGGLGSILVGLPTDYFQAVTRSGEPEAGMPAFDQNAISDDDLSTLAKYLSSLTLQNIDVELPPVVVGHLSQARDALQEGGDKAAVQTYLDKAQEAGADAPPGVQATLKGLAGGLEGADWMEVTEARLEVLLER